MLHTLYSILVIDVAVNIIPIVRRVRVVGGTRLSHINRFKRNTVVVRTSAGLPTLVCIVSIIDTQFTACV